MTNKCKIVIIDDEFIMRQGIKYILDWEKEGFQIVGEATNGQEGLDLIEEVNPDIVLADIVMPKIDGVELADILSKKYPDIQLIILSSYDKFEYVRAALLNGAVDYILKPTLSSSILLKALLKAAANIPGFSQNKNGETSYGHLFENYILGYIDKLDDIVFAEIFPNTLYRILGVNLKTISKGNKAKMAEIERMIIMDFKDIDEYECLCRILEEKYLIIVLNYRIKDEKTIIPNVELCAKKISKIYDNIFFVISKSFSDMQQIKHFYQKSIKEHIDLKFYYPNQMFYIIDKNRINNFERFEFDEFTRRIQNNQFVEAYDLLQNYVKYAISILMDEDRLKNITKNLVYNFIIEIQREDFNEEQFKDEFFTAIDDTQNIDEFECEFNKFSLYLIENIQRMSENDIIKKIKRYIDENLNKNLDLVNIAELYGFSYHYLSAYFNKHSKEGFSEYLNKVRIDRAKHMLQKTNMSISSISEEVGYSEQSYFCKVFKKIVGLTPSNYRRKSRKEDSHGGKELKTK